MNIHSPRHEAVEKPLTQKEMDAARVGLLRKAQLLVTNASESGLEAPEWALLLCRRDEARQQRTMRRLSIFGPTKSDREHARGLVVTTDELWGTTGDLAGPLEIYTGKHRAEEVKSLGKISIGVSNTLSDTRSTLAYHPQPTASAIEFAKLPPTQHDQPPHQL